MNIYDLHNKPESLHLHDHADKNVPAVFYDKYKSKPEELKKREDAIAKSNFACSYALYILKGPFPKGESTISKDPVQAYFYAKHIIKGPWPKGELCMSRDSEMAARYAMDILKEPWPKGEAAVAASKSDSAPYIKCFPERTEAILQLQKR